MENFSIYLLLFIIYYYFLLRILKEIPAPPPKKNMGIGRGESAFVVYSTQSFHFFLLRSNFEKYLFSPFIPVYFHKVYLRCYSVFHNSSSFSILQSKKLWSTV